VQLAGLPEKTHQVINYTWLAGLPFHMADGTPGRFAADWGFLLDPLSSGHDPGGDGRRDF
jgi:hypothetical protein